MAREVIAPALLKERDKGKLRFLGVTEAASSDDGHEMVALAAADGLWDSAMIAFHMLHQNARERVFPLTLQHRVGTLLMFAVRNIFSQPERLKATLRELAAAGAVPRALAESGDPLGFLIHDGGARSLVDAAYRFVVHEPGVDVVLFGTGEITHLRANIASLLAPPLPESDRDRLKKLFGGLVGVGLDLPGFAGGPAPAA
jgi:L-galactose dehydrogenase